MSCKSLDHRIFDNYTEESCYWAGFLAADGCIDINGTIRIELNGVDKDHVIAFKEYCKAEHIISYNKERDSYKIGFVSDSIKDSLYYNFGVTVGKTFNLQVPIFINDSSYQSFYRGFFDGDGCLTEFYNNRPKATFRVFLTSASLQFLTDTLALLRHMNIIVGGSIQKKATNCWHIQLGVKDSTSFLNWIYQGSGIKLHRKYIKYHNLIVLGNRASKNEPK